MANFLTGKNFLIILASLLSASAFVVGLAWNDYATEVIPSANGLLIYAILVTILFLIAAYYVGEYLPESFDRFQGSGNSSARIVGRAERNEL